MVYGHNGGLKLELIRALLEDPASVISIARYSSSGGRGGADDEADAAAAPDDADPADADTAAARGETMGDHDVLLFVDAYDALVLPTAGGAAARGAPIVARFREACSRATTCAASGCILSSTNHDE